MYHPQLDRFAANIILCHYMYPYVYTAASLVREIDMERQVRVLARHDRPHDPWPDC